MATRKTQRKTAPKIRLEDFEKKIVLRPIRIEDYDQLVEMQRSCFQGMQTWGRDQIESQIRIFGEGQLCIEYQGRVIASSGSLVVDFDMYEDWHNWRVIADGGYIRNHDPEGDTLYGIEIMVHPDFRGMRLARRLYEARKELARSMNLPVAWGVLVAQVEPGSPAARSGIKVGDLIVQMGRYRVQTLHQAVRILRDARPGDTVDLAIVRNQFLARTRVQVR